jgi:hypothetical protein
MGLSRPHRRGSGEKMLHPLLGEETQHLHVLQKAVAIPPRIRGFY